MSQSSATSRSPHALHVIHEHAIHDIIRHDVCGMYGPQPFHSRSTLPAEPDMPRQLKQLLDDPELTEKYEGF